MFKYTRFALVTLLAVSTAAYASEKNSTNTNKPEQKSYYQSTKEFASGAMATVVAAAFSLWRAGYTVEEYAKLDGWKYYGVQAGRVTAVLAALYGVYYLCDAYCGDACKAPCVKRPARTVNNNA